LIGTQVIQEEDSELYRRGRAMFAGMRTGVDFWTERGLAHVGSPETIIRRLEKQQELCGYDVFGARFRMGPMPDALVEKSITLFGEKVIPAFA
jgi:alkanesulfonate monooxygenase SsuD/methylene tetrahydromethanopterin reductase-like flavin-dependent oxidoreductase (luciferase family)